MIKKWNLDCGSQVSGRTTAHLVPADGTQIATENIPYEQIQTYAERHAMTVIDVVDSDVGLGAIVYEVRSTTGEGKGRDPQFTERIETLRTNARLWYPQGDARSFCVGCAARGNIRQSQHKARIRRVAAI